MVHLDHCQAYGSGHFIQGLNVVGNVFKALYGNVERIDRVDTSIADLNYNSMRNLQFEANTFNGINTYVSNPLMIQLTQNTATATWTTPVLTGSHSRAGRGPSSPS